MKNKFDISLYNDEFYKWHHTNVHLSSVRAGASLKFSFLDFHNFDSVIDIGCGIGSFILGVKESGIKKVKGYDIGGEYAKKYVIVYLFF